jgi:uncharacterized membrane protein HdeD (DUF308 family)
MLVTQPGATIVALTTFLGFYWLITGLLGLVQVFVDRSTPWLWSLLSGIVGILAGLFVLRHPLVAALTVPTMLVLILGVQGLVMGALQIVGGFKGGRHRTVHPRRDQRSGWTIAAGLTDRGGVGCTGCIRSTTADPGRGINYFSVSGPRLKICSSAWT